MRNQLIELIFESMVADKKIKFLTGDLGFSVLEKMQKKFSNRFVNVGISENNMILLSVGLSEIKKNLIYAYSISSFLILRCAEIIRNYLSNERRNIRLIGVGSGVSYGTMGKTHYNLDDINILYSFQNITLLNPANIDELNFVYKKFIKYNGPLYFRINKNNFHNTNKLIQKKNFFYKKGTSCNLIVSGAIMNYILDFFTESEIKKINIISLPIMNINYLHNLKQFTLQKKKTLMIADSSKTIFFEDVAKYLGLKNNYYNLGLDHNRIKYVGDEKELLRQMGITRKNLANYLF